MEDKTSNLERNINLNGTHNDNQSNLPTNNYHDSFFNPFETNTLTQCSENTSNYLNNNDELTNTSYLPPFYPPFETQRPNIQPCNNNSHQMQIDDHHTNYPSLFFPPFEVNASHTNNLMDNNDISQPHYNTSADLTSLTTTHENGVADSNNLSLLSLFQKAISNPEERTALTKLFRQLSSFDDAESRPNSSDPHENQNNSQYPPFNPNSYSNHYNMPAKDNYGYILQPQNAHISSNATDLTQLPSNFANMTAKNNETELAYVNPPTNNGPITYENYYGSKRSPINRQDTEEVANQNYSFKFPLHLSPMRPDSEPFDTVAQSSDDSRGSMSTEFSSPRVGKDYTDYLLLKTKQVDLANRKFTKKTGIRKISNIRRKNVFEKNISSYSDTSNLTPISCRRKNRHITNRIQMIDGNTNPSLFTKFPKHVGNLHLKIVLQPDMYHRARYLTEGSRTTLRDLSQSSYPTVKLSGYDGERAKLHVFVGSEGNSGIPSLFYQISRASVKNSLSPRELTIDGINVLEYDFAPDQNMTVINDGIGILKLRNSDVEHRFGVKSRKKNSKCCLIYRAIVPCNEMGFTIVQIRSNPIICVQPMGNPEITKVIPPSAFPGNDLAIIGKNFLKNAFVLFYDKITDNENSSGKRYSWSMQALIDSDLSTPMHLVCKVPFYPEEYARTNISQNLNIVVRCNNRSSQPTTILYKNPNCAH